MTTKVRLTNNNETDGNAVLLRGHNTCEGDVNSALHPGQDREIWITDQSSLIVSTSGKITITNENDERGKNVSLSSFDVERGNLDHTLSPGHSFEITLTEQASCTVREQSERSEPADTEQEPKYSPHTPNMPGSPVMEPGGELKA